jgi:predicted regulator of Ras-like GTPase activity (Roadblock/LC7/MglB family)
MAFTPLLRAIVDGCRGGLGAVLMGFDGMPIEEALAAGAPASLSEDLATAGVEFGRILAEMRKAADGVGGGELLDATVRLGGLTLVLSVVDDETFLAVAVAPDGNAGQARYLLRRQMAALRDEL